MPSTGEHLVAWVPALSCAYSAAGAPAIPFRIQTERNMRGLGTSAATARMLNPHLIESRDVPSRTFRVTAITLVAHCQIMSMDCMWVAEEAAAAAAVEVAAAEAAAGVEAEAAKAEAVVPAT